VDLWTTPIFELLTLEYPELVWHQDEALILTWGGKPVRVYPAGPLRTI
jgi:hypothetical protein